jgi:Tol biopolymer transport system component
VRTAERLGLLALLAVLSASPATSLAATTDDADTDGASLHGARFIDLASGGRKTLPEGLVPVSARDLRFSPDRRRLAYVGPGPDDPAGSLARLWVVDVDGMSRRPLSPTGHLPDDPAWSPDSGSIAYIDDQGISIVHVDSGRVRRLRGVRGSRLWLPEFRPDGRAILYTRVADHGRRMELWTVPVRIGQPRRFLRDAAFGSWSPDGSTVAFRRFGRAVRDGSIWPYDYRGIHLADSKGGRVRTLIHRAGSMMAPIDWSPARLQWSPGGNRLVFGFPEQNGSVRVMDIGTRRIVHVGCGRWPTWWDGGMLFVEQHGSCGPERAGVAKLGAARAAG